jgi:thiamine monophosphate synthase
LTFVSGLLSAGATYFRLRMRTDTLANAMPPTPESVNQAERRAKAGIEAVLARAKKLDAEGKRAACMEALTDAKLIYFQ